MGRINTDNSGMSCIGLSITLSNDTATATSGAAKKPPPVSAHAGTPRRCSSLAYSFAYRFALRSKMQKSW